MKPLSIKDAFYLYYMLAPYIPETGSTDTGIEFIGKILDALIEENQHHLYLDAIALMHQVSVDQLVELNIQELLDMFAEGLSENKILDLKEFCEKAGVYGNR